MATDVKVSPTIWTIGHGNLDWLRFLTALQTFEIQTVADVRSSPRSRFPRFNRIALERELAAASIDYRFFGDAVGGRPADSSCYRGGRVPEKSADVFSLIDYDIVETKAWCQEGLTALLNLARSTRLAVMCSEGDPNQCHRHHLIARSLTDRAAVHHILAREQPPVLVAAADLPAQRRLSS